MSSFVSLFDCRQVQRHTRVLLSICHEWPFKNSSCGYHCRNSKWLWPQLNLYSTKILPYVLSYGGFGDFWSLSITSMNGCLCNLLVFGPGIILVLLMDLEHVLGLDGTVHYRQVVWGVIERMSEGHTGSKTHSNNHHTTCWDYHQQNALSTKPKQLDELQIQNLSTRNGV